MPKYRKKEIYDARELKIEKILRQLCERKNVNIIETAICNDHINVDRIITKKYICFNGYLKETNSYMIFEKLTNVGFKYSN